MEYSLDDLLRITAQKGATDLHLCAGARPLIRISANLTQIEDAKVFSGEDVNVITRSLLTQEQIDSMQHNRVIDFSFSRSGLGRFRGNAYSQRGTFALAIRILPFEIPPFSKLHLPESAQNFVKQRRGLVLVTGTAGSGKSTTLASLIDHINETSCSHIITIEDPIEYLHRHKRSLLTQREIGPDALTFAQALRSALREDPDVIMVGEMRDPETIAIALTAAETGHLVLSTLHTMGAAKSIDRIIDAFPPAQQNQIKTQLATVLEGIVSQQLLPRIDMPGMIPACEIMLVNPAIRNLIREGKHYQINSVIQTGHTQGMQLLESSLAALVKDNIISMEDAVIRAGDPLLLHQLLNRV